MVGSVCAGAAASTRRTTRHTGVLRGAVTRGPSCSGTDLCSEPLPGIRILFVRDGRTVKQTTSGADGIYRVRLRAGRYGVRVPGHQRWQPSGVRVLRGQVSRVDISIDTLGRQLGR